MSSRVFYLPMRTLLKTFLISYVALCSVIGVVYLAYFHKPSEVSANDSVMAGRSVVSINPPSILLVGEVYHFEAKLDENLVGKGHLEVSSDNGTLVSLNGFSSTGGDSDAMVAPTSSISISIKPLNPGLTILRMKCAGEVYEVPMYVKNISAVKMSVTNLNEGTLILGDMSKPIRIDLVDLNGESASLKEDLNVSIKNIPGLEIYNSSGTLLPDGVLEIPKGTSSSIFTIKQNKKIDYVPLEITSALGNFWESIYMSEGSISSVTYNFPGNVNYQVGNIIGPIKLRWINQFGVEIDNDLGQEVKILSSNSQDIKCGANSLDISSQGSVYLERGENTVFCIFYGSGERDLSFFINPDAYIDDNIKPLAFNINPGVPEKLVLDDENISLELGEQRNVSAYLVDKYGNKVNSDMTPTVRVGAGSNLISTSNSLISLKGDTIGTYPLSINYGDYDLSTIVSVVYGDVVSINPSYYSLKLENNSSPAMLDFKAYNRYGYNIPVDKDYIIKGLNPQIFTDANGVGIGEVTIKKGDTVANVFVNSSGTGVLQYSLHTDLNEFSISIDFASNNIIADASVLGSSTIYGSDYRVSLLETSLIRVGEEANLNFLLLDRYGNVVLPYKYIKYQVYADREGTIKIGDLLFEPYSSFAKMSFYTEKLGEQSLYIYNEGNFISQFEISSFPGKPFKLDSVNADYSLKESIPSDMYIFELVDKFGNKTTADDTLEFSVSLSKPTAKISLLLDPWKDIDRIFIYKGESIVSFYVNDPVSGSGNFNLTEVKHSVENFEISYEMEK